MLLVYLFRLHVYSETSCANLSLSLNYVASDPCDPCVARDGTYFFVELWGARVICELEWKLR